jgi:hypothetical protein
MVLRNNEFYRMAKGAVRGGVKEKRFRSGAQWEVLRRDERALIVRKNGVEKQPSLDETRNFSVFERGEDHASNSIRMAGRPAQVH